MSNIAFGWRGCQIDEIRVGKTWSDVAPIPEPGSAAMLLAGLGLVGIAAGRRRAGLARQGRDVAGQA